MLYPSARWSIVQRPIPYLGTLPRRPMAALQCIVIHCTETPDLALARELGEQVQYASGNGNCGHFYIDRDGSVEQWVRLNRAANHVAGMNRHTVGIELVNSGRYPHWFDTGSQSPTEAYPNTQIDSLIALLAWLQIRCPQLQRIVGHEELDQRRVPASDKPDETVVRKLDPGPMFPWRVVRQRLTGFAFNS